MIRKKIICLLLILLMVVPNITINASNNSKEGAWGRSNTDYVHNPQYTSNPGGVGNEIEAILNRTQVKAAPNLSSIRWYTAYRAITVTFTNPHLNTEESFSMLAGVLDDDWEDGMVEGAIAADTHYVAISIKDPEKGGSFFDTSSSNYKYTVLGNVMQQIMSNGGESAVFGKLNEPIVGVRAVLKDQFTLQQLCSEFPKTAKGTPYTIGVTIQLQSIIGIAPPGINAKYLKALPWKDYKILPNNNSTQYASVINTAIVDLRDRAIQAYGLTGTYRNYVSSYFAVTNSGPINLLTPGTGLHSHTNIASVTGVNFSAQAKLDIADAVSNQYFIVDAVAPIEPIEETPPTVVDSDSDDDLVPRAEGVIKADTRGSERYDVSQGIPTSENLYVNILSQEYLFSQGYKQVSGSKTFYIDVNKRYNVTRIIRDTSKTDPNATKEISDFTTRSELVSVSLDYSYYQIDNFELYKIKNATVINNSLPGGKVVLEPSGYIVPTITINADTNKSNHIKLPSYSSTVWLSEEDVTIDETKGESITDIPSLSWSSSNPNVQSEINSIRNTFKVKNDKLVVNGTTYLSDEWRSYSQAPTKTDLTSSDLINQNVLYKNNLTIPYSLPNGSYTSLGQIVYERVGSSINPKNPDIIQANFEVNPVTLHTPVYCQIQILTDETLRSRQISDSYQTIHTSTNQTIRINQTGTHKNIPGYGYQDYSKYSSSTELKASFDFYIGGKTGKYIVKNTWSSIGNANEIQIYIPDWSPIGPQTIETRATALNSNNNSTETQANLNRNNTIATSSVTVYLEPQMSNFTVTYIDDVHWSVHFTNGSYKTIDKSKTFSASEFPITPKSNTNINNNPGTKSLAIKKGYNFYFDLQVSGFLNTSNSYLEINPTYYYIDKEGKNRKEVDLYFFTNNTMISGKDTSKTKWYSATLDSWVRGIPRSEINNTKAAYKELLGANHKTITSISNKEKILLGSTYSITLPNELRTFTGNINSLPYSITQTKGLTSISRWSGQFNLPKNTAAVPKGTTIANTKGLTEESPLFLHNGYIIIHFDIYLNHNGIRYDYTPRWAAEDYNVVQPYQVTYGDIILYETDHDASEDYSIGK